MKVSEIKQRWEYKVVITRQWNDAESELNQLGLDGWELAAIQNYSVFLKRPLPPPAEEIEGVGI